MQVRCDGYWLTEIGDVSDIEWSTAWRRDGWSGDFEASWTFAADPNFTPPFLSRGAQVELVESGVTVWGGLLTEPERGRPWRMFARGYGAEASRFSAVTYVEPPGVWESTSVPDTAFDSGVARGMPLVRDGSLGVAAVTPGDGQPLWMVADLLDAAAASQEKRWHVDPYGVVTLRTDPTAPTWATAPTDALMGTADDEYVSHLWGYYVTAESGTPPEPSAWGWVLRADEAAAARWGRVERVVDLTRLGVISAGAAQAQIDSRFGLAGARMGYTNGLELDGLSLRRVDAGAVNTRFLRAGEMLRVHGVADVGGNRLLGGSADIVIGETRHRADTDVVTVLPLGLVPRSLSDVLAAPQPEPVEAV